MCNWGRTFRSYDSPSIAKSRGCERKHGLDRVRSCLLREIRLHWRHLELQVSSNHLKILLVYIFGCNHVHIEFEMPTNDLIFKKSNLCLILFSTLFYVKKQQSDKFDSSGVEKGSKKTGLKPTRECMKT